jgi:3-hydroxyisobutyrate dehydrogenase-like beta-hydroxyacid dehydrogenase
MNAANIDDAIVSAGVIGLGVMGLPISVNIAKAGFEVSGYDILPQRIENLVANGGKAAGSALEVAEKAQVVLTSLPSLAAFEDVVWGRQGILASGAEGLIVMECSTLAADDKQRAGEDMAKSGMVLLDCPISGGSRAAQKDLVVYGSGHQETYARCLPIVNAFARANYYLGEFGNGTKMKLVANLLVTIHNVSTAEAMVFGMKSGLDPETIFKVMCDSSGRSRMFEVRGPRMVEDNYQNPTMRVKTFRKDLEIIARQAADINCPTPLFTSCVQLYLGALAQGLDEQDTASVCTVLEKWAHLEREQLS